MKRQQLGSIYTPTPSFVQQQQQQQQERSQARSHPSLPKHSTITESRIGWTAGPRCLGQIEGSTHTTHTQTHTHYLIGPCSVLINSVIQNLQSCHGDLCHGWKIGIPEELSLRKEKTISSDYLLLVIIWNLRGFSLGTRCTVLVLSPSTGSYKISFQTMSNCRWYSIEKLTVDLLSRTKSV